MTTTARLYIGLTASAVLLGSTPALAQHGYDYRRDANFAGITTFAFKDTPPMDPDANKTTTYDSPLMRERTNAAIGAQLQARGMTRNDKNPDVYIVTHRSYKVDYTYFGPYGWGPYWGGYGYSGGWYGGGDVYEELRGTLTVDVEDAKSGHLLWRGIETKHVHQSSKPSKRDARVNDEVADIFKHFPMRGAVATTGER